MDRISELSETPLAVLKPIRRNDSAGYPGVV